MLSRFINKHNLTDHFKDNALTYWHPLADEIVNWCQHQYQQHTPIFVGVNGCQGSGKSTLCQYLKQYLHNNYQLNVVCLSLDDFYLSSNERAKHGKSIHPLFATRGVPGTHNIPLLTHILNKLTALSERQELTLPQFDKLTDEPLAIDFCPKIAGKVDVVLFEGWCWGVAAQDDKQLTVPINRLEKHYDPLLVWRKTINQLLKQDYMPLYQQMHYWLMLKAPNFDCVYQWRLEQEQKMLTQYRAKSAKSLMTNKLLKAMSAEEVASFVEYFQRLTEHALIDLPPKMDKVFILNANREVIGVQSKTRKEQM
ncbi:P-loop NTPase fold protein [Litorilituus sediminis]|uniref:P-loop NTPase fold protein n=1 Tax=Litorilituus sediminis TaxID=718192 RepID=UPI0014769E31|nr:P-loop NTPase fold protein [Litorilituus sediminis]